MERTRFLIVIVLLMAIISGCDRWFSEDEWDCPGLKLPSHNDDKVTIQQGIWGDVWFWEGDFMPVCPSGTVMAVSREMRIHELTSVEDVEPTGARTFYRVINTELVATATSDSLGFFEVALAPGIYSIFAVEDSMFYVNRFDGQGNIFPVTVNEGQVTGITFDIDYLSSW